MLVVRAIVCSCVLNAVLTSIAQQRDSTCRRSFSAPYDASVMPVIGAKGGVHGGYYLRSVMAKCLLGFDFFLGGGDPKIRV